MDREIKARIELANERAARAAERTAEAHEAAARAHERHADIAEEIAENVVGAIAPASRRSACASAAAHDRNVAEKSRAVLRRRRRRVDPESSGTIRRSPAGGAARDV